MNHNIVFYGLVSFSISLLCIPVIIMLSRKFGIYDPTCDRKIHNGNISRLGGIAVFLGFFPIAIYLIIKYNGGINYLLIAGMATAFLSGIIDDFVGMKARYKLIIQIAAALMVAFSGLLIHDLRIYTIIHVQFGLFSYVITVCWIVTFMNAVNLIDGMDGLSTGIFLIANLFVIIISLLQHNYLVLSLAVCLEFAILGFYLFNFPPAKIFLGDAGAYFIGFVYAVLPLLGIKKSAAMTVFLIPMVLLLIPISDIVSVMLRRWKNGGHTLFRPDNNHIHHRLLNIGLTNRGVLKIIYTFTAILGCFSLLMVLGKPHNTIFMLLFILTVVGFVFYTLGKLEKRIKVMESFGERIRNITIYSAPEKKNVKKRQTLLQIVMKKMAS